MNVILDQEAWENKFSSLKFLEDHEKLRKGRELYPTYLQHYPTAINRWCEYLDLEMQLGTRENTEMIFRKCLKQLPDVEIVKRYLIYINTNFKDNDRLDATTRTRNKKIVENAYRLAIKLIGNDINSISIYEEFIRFLEETGDHQLIFVLLENISRTPINDRAELSIRYEAGIENEEERRYEHSIYEATKVYQSRLLQAYTKTEALKKINKIGYCTQQKTNGAKEAFYSFMNILDVESKMEGQPHFEDRLYISNGITKKWEICPHSLKMKTQQERMYYTMNKMLYTFYRYPQAWLICAQHFQRRGNLNLAINFLERGRRAVNCPLLKLYESFCYFLKGDMNQALSLLSNENELEQVTKIKFAARKYSLSEFRKMINEMNKELSPYGMIALAETEYFFYGRKTAAMNVFKEALKRYANNNQIIKSYYRFLNGITPSRFISRALKSYGNEEIDRFMKMRIEEKGKTVK